MKSKLNIFCYFCLTFTFISMCCMAGFCFILFLLSVLELTNPILGIYNIEIIILLSIVFCVLFFIFSVLLKGLLNSKQFN